ncbi:pilus assembly protein [Parahaliea mediterranea]|uniref:PilY1 beta-propeller domain-containing protein n=1 Tax=Parahaliea mediterranea TaxID=651086 RepID=A0A939DCS0_9GAMM|nr:PilC/PilY family type IV pilus protein [Parahaliea mediterranea]MBN7795685.1 hypothetical protein [Parahaliea mediterranea]
MAVSILGSGAQADDTEIYKASYDGTGVGGRPKVLIVFDDSGSMSTEVDQQRPPYDPDSDYEVSFPPGRLYWTTGNSVPSPDSNNWFSASQNRCASSYENLDVNGQVTVTRARRWVDSTTQQGQCSWQCPDDSVYRSQANPRGCYTQETTLEPAPKLVRRQGYSYRFSIPSLGIYINPYCPNSWLMVDDSSSLQGCYESVTTTQPLAGWVRRGSPSGNSNNCPNGTTPLTVEGGRGCYQNQTAPEYEEVTSWQYYSSRVRVCENETVVPGSWEALSAQDQTPTHAECRDDVDSGNPDNGLGLASGYPQDNVANGQEYGPAPDASVDWGNQAYTFYTSHYLDWYHDDSLVEPRSRLSIAQEVVSTLISTNKGVDFGLMEFNYSQGGRIVQRIVEDMSEADRDNLVTMINLIDHGGSTPLCESFYEAYRYMSGSSVVYGSQARAGSDSRGVWDVLPRDQLAQSGSNYISPVTDCANTYVIVMTDGFPQNDTDANSSIETLTGKTCNRYRDANGNNTKSCMPELAEYMANTDLDDDPSNGSQYGITYTIGFATDQELLRDTAEKGKGEYYTASNAQELASAFQGAITSILSTATTFTAPAVAVNTFNRTQSREEVFYAMFKPGESVDWIGNIKKLRVTLDESGEAVLVDANGDTAIDPETGYIKDSAVTYWGSSSPDGGSVDKGGVGALLAARDPATRNIYINTGTGGALQPFNTTNVTAEALGVADDQAVYELFGASTYAAFSRQIAWARGFDAFSSDSGNRDQPRSWVLGDILHSQPLILNYGARGGYSEENPDLRLVVGTNHGFVHMFSADDGVEDWAFFPKELAPILPDRRRNAISNANIYGMDLTPVAYTYDANGDGTIDVGGGDKVWVFLGMRRGGKSYYALDLSNPDTPAFMWRIGPDVSGFELMGQTWSEPVVTRIPGYRDASGEPRPVLVFGGGYDTNKDGYGLATQDSVGRGVYIVDAQTGALVWSVTPAVNSATNLSASNLHHSVAAGVTLVDSNADRLADRIYFADTGGNLWRVDMPGNTLPGASQEVWQVNRLASLNRGTAVTDRRFFNAPDMVRIRFNGQAMNALIIGSGDRTNPNGTDVVNRVYMIRDPAVTPYITPRPSAADCADPGTADFRCSMPLVDNDLLDVTNNLITTGTEEEQAAALEALRAANGWRFDLQGLGEKSLSKTLTIDGTVYVSTFTPANLVDAINVCEPQAGSGRMYIVDLYNGDWDYIPLGPTIPDIPPPIVPPRPPCEEGEDCIDPPPGLYIPLAPGSGEDGMYNTGKTVPRPYGTHWFQEQF